MSEREIHFDAIGNIFAAVEKWFDEIGLPLTDEQRQAVAGAGISTSESPYSRVKAGEAA